MAESATSKPKVLSPKQAEHEKRWNHLSTLMACDAKRHDYFQSEATNFSKRKGSVVMIGSGIKSVGQFTLEAVSHIKSADRVLYCVADPATEVFIQDLRPDALDLYVFYADDKKRYDTYMQMSEACLYFARRGLHVVGIFYGHPGVFVLPSHRAIQVAEQQGIEAYMLPAVSAEDCLFADLGIDPSYPGLQTLEATDMLLRKRQLLTSSHVIIWQVGCVGDLGFRRKGYLNPNFHVLIKYLQAIYGEDYVITHYVAAQFPMCGPLIERLPLKEFLQPDIAKRVSGISTFYVPPMEAAEVDPEMAVTLGIVQSAVGVTFTKHILRPRATYGPREVKAISDLDQWTVPTAYAHTSPSKPAHYMVSVATDIKQLRQHKDHPEESMKAAGLSQSVIAAFDSKHSGRIRVSLKTGPDNVAQQVVFRIGTDPAFASAFAAALRKVESEDEMNRWLQLHGYDTTLDSVFAARTKLQESSLFTWSGTYPTNVTDITIKVQGDIPPATGKVWVTGIPVKKLIFAEYNLKWASSDGNASSATLVFKDEGKGVFSFTGKYWKSGDPEPTSDNINGQNTTSKSPLVWIFAEATRAFWKKLKDYFNNPTEENKQAMQEAQEQADKAGEALAEAEQNVETTDTTKPSLPT